MNFPFFSDKIKSYALPLTRNYVAHWGMTEATRELLQNAIDSESPFRCTYIDGTLRIVSEDSHLPTRTLLLGATSKAHDETKIGSFGEGYKIALLVLCRLGKAVTVYNDKVVWRPDIRMCESFGEEVMYVDEVPRQGSWSDRLIFEVSNVTPEEYDQIQRSCIHLWEPDHVGEVIETRYGRILKDHQGKIYVNGLFVCDMQLDYSYDVNPMFLRLERDRQTINGFDAKLVTKNMWFDSKRYDEVAELIELGSPDLEHADLGTPELIKESLYKRFKAKHPGAVAVKSQAELDRCVANGVTDTVYVKETHHSILNTVSDYKASARKMDVKTPQEELEIWLRNNRGHMRKDAIVSFKDLVQKAQGWKIKGS